ncbi:MAG: hypothetical protein KC420_08905 [Myxococcales bacterium]|nr:hypothetical protein [Myxococcales bacterium]
MSTRASLSPSLSLAPLLLAGLLLAGCSGGGGTSEASASEGTDASTATSTGTSASVSGSSTSAAATSSTTDASGTQSPTIDDQGCLEECGALELCVEGECAAQCLEADLFGESAVYALNCSGVGGCYAYEACEGGCEVVDGLATCKAAAACDPVDPPPCAVDACVQSWSYACPDCGVEFDAGRCFAISEGCAYPGLACALPKPCPRVWAHSLDFGTLDIFESEDAAICVLDGLRSGAAAAYEILWGEMSDEGVTVLEALVDGQGGATIQWYVDCQGCPESGRVGRSGRLALQPQAYFDACLNAPTTASLIDCIYGFTEYVEGAGPADDYTPPWTTGECLSLDFACPG